MSAVGLAFEAPRIPVALDIPQARPSLELELRAVTALASAEDVTAGMARVLELLLRDAGAVRAEWWAPDVEGVLRSVVTSGSGGGRQQSFELGGDGAIVIVGDLSRRRTIDSLVAAVRPVLRRRRTEERLADAAIRLARRNAALEDFAALVAHELKTPLHAALLAEDPSVSVEQALDLVDSLLEASRSEQSPAGAAPLPASLAEVLRELAPADVAVGAELPETFPLPAEPLKIILRNLLRNAIAAGAHTIQVSVDGSPRASRLVVDDDGVGLGEEHGYRAGSGLGLGLSRHIASRFGGTIELAPGPVGGTRATLELPEAA